MVSISSFSYRTNSLDFKHSVSCQCLFCVALYPNDLFVISFWGEEGIKQQYCVWKLYSVSGFPVYVNHLNVIIPLWFYSDCEAFNASIQLFSH